MRFFGRLSLVVSINKGKQRMTQSEAPNGFLIQGSEAYKIAQAVYHTVTGKTETVSKRFSENYKIGFEDIKQLHAKCTQMCTQWEVIEQNENITVYHVDDNKEVFTSVDRLKLYDQSQTSPIESITYEYNALLKLPDMAKPQPYKITVRMASRIALMRKTESEGPSPLIMRFFRGGVINLDIEYVDYVVARNMISTLDSWVREIEVTKKNRILSSFQRYSHWVPKISGLLLLLLATMSAVFSADTIVTASTANSLLAKFLIASFGFVATSYFVGTWFGRMAEYSIYRIQEISYIEINKGDKKLLEQFKSSNKSLFIKASVSFSLITIHAVACSYIGTMVFESLI
jgi:hypothetical protein